jgi:hypothetical protein
MSEAKYLRQSRVDRRREARLEERERESVEGCNSYTDAVHKQKLAQEMVRGSVCFYMQARVAQIRLSNAKTMRY